MQVYVQLLIFWPQQFLQGQYRAVHSWYMQQWDVVVLWRMGHIIVELGWCNEACSSAGCWFTAAAGTPHGDDEATSIHLLSWLHSGESVRPGGQCHPWQLKVGTPGTFARGHPRLQGVTTPGHCELCYCPKSLHFLQQIVYVICCCWFLLLVSGYWKLYITSLVTHWLSGLLWRN